MPKLFDHVDFRVFLRAYYSACKGCDPTFSHRVFSGRMGFASPNFMKMVMDGNRNLGDESLRSIINGMGFSLKEGEYFSCLVAFDQAKGIEARNEAFRQIMALRAIPVLKITPAQFDYFAQWYHCVVRELVVGSPVDVDPNEIARRIRPCIAADEIVKSIELLERLGLISRSAEGRFEQTSPLVETENEVQSHAIRQFHRQMLDLARRSLAECPPAKREISCATVRVSEAGFRQIKERIQSFRTELLQLAAQDQTADRVYQVNMQAFPVSDYD